MLGCKAAISPIEENHKLEEKRKEPLDDAGIRGLWENVRYLTITRPDITYAVGLVSQYMHAPCQAHLHVVYRILRYLKGFLGKGMIYTNHGHGRVEIYSNVDWGGSVEDRRSTLG